MKDTQDNVPSVFEGKGARDYCAQTLKREQNKVFDDVFSEWDDEPIGVASIGEVHRAVLRENGQVVAVKLQLPDMEKRFRADIRTVKTFCRMAMPQHVPVFDEIEKQFCTEFDYRGEAENLATIREAVLPVWGQYVDIPKPHMHHCSKHMMVMDFMEGRKLVDSVKASYKALAASTGRSLEELEAQRKRDIERGTYKFTTVEEESAKTASLNWWLSMRDMTRGWNPVKLMYNYSPLRLIFGPYEYERSTQLLDMGRVLDILCKVHGFEIFHLGVFNADCHPGNVLLLPDGRLGLIDYGERLSMMNMMIIIF